MMIEHTSNIDKELQRLEDEMINAVDNWVHKVFDKYRKIEVTNNEEHKN